MASCLENKKVTKLAPVKAQRLVDLTAHSMARMMASAI